MKPVPILSRLYNISGESYIYGKNIRIPPSPMARLLSELFERANAAEQLTYAHVACCDLRVSRLNKRLSSHHLCKIHVAHAHMYHGFYFAPYIFAIATMIGIARYNRGQTESCISCHGRDAAVGTTRRPHRDRDRPSLPDPAFARARLPGDGSCQPLPYHNHAPATRMCWILVCIGSPWAA